MENKLIKLENDEKDLVYGGEANENFDRAVLRVTASRLTRLDDRFQKQTKLTESEQVIF